MGNLNEFFRDLGRNAYGLGENVASLGSAAIAEPVAGFAAMYDPVNGAAAIREGMTYTPRTEAGQMYQQGAARTLGAIAQPAMPVIDAWQRGVDVAGKYSPVTGAALQTVPTAIGALMGYKPAMQTGRQVSNSLGAMQQRMVQNASAPNLINNGYRNQRGVFAGINALTADREALAKAKEMIAKGDFPDDVWKETGWGQGADGKWRFEIDDSGSSLNMMNFPEQGASSINTTLPEFLKHPRVYQNYPEAKKMSVLAKNESGNGTGTMMGDMEGLMIVRGSGDNARLTTLHELQHAIQQREGFARGGNPEQFRGTPEFKNEAYRRLAGEVESRMVENRMDLTPEQRRDIYPFAVGRYGYEDTPKKRQIIDFGNNKANAQRPLTEFEQAHLLAQQRAALPVNQGGLGLAPDNTAMDRARAMGWVDDGYHGTSSDFPEFSLGGYGVHGNVGGTGVYLGVPDMASSYAQSASSLTGKPANVMPLLTRGKLLDTSSEAPLNNNLIDKYINENLYDGDKARIALDAGGKRTTRTFENIEDAKDFFWNQKKNWEAFGGFDRTLPKADMIDGKPVVSYVDFNAPVSLNGLPTKEVHEALRRAGGGTMTDILKNIGYDGTKSARETVIFDPKNIRSRFAAFDPFNRESSNLLAQYGAIAPTATLGAMMYNEQQRKKQGK